MGIFNTFCNVLMILSALYCTRSSGLKIQETKTVFSSEAFLIPISRDWFPTFRTNDPVEYTSSLLDMPDLPSWMFSSQPLNSSAFLYGSPDESGDYFIETIALNLNTYETASSLLLLKVEPREAPRYEVELRIVNLDVWDVFRGDRLRRLEDVFRGSLWGEDVYATRVVSSVDAGGRRPLDPNTKEGVLVRVGGASGWSRDLESLEREVRPLRARGQPCPRDYKRTSAEHLFRSRGLVPDWCSFRLIVSNEEHGTEGEQRPLVVEDRWHPPSEEKLPRRDLSMDFVVSLVVPAAFVAILSTALTCLMCCNRETAGEKNNTDGGSLQQLDQVGKREGSFPSDSPASTLPRNCTLRSSSRSGTLRSVVQPPPYPSFPPSYAGSTAP